MYKFTFRYCCLLAPGGVWVPGSKILHVCSGSIWEYRCSIHSFLITDLNNTGSLAHPTAKMKPENHEFGVPRWPPQDFLLIETLATSVATYIDQARKTHWNWSTEMAPVASTFYWQNILYAWSSDYSDSMFSNKQIVFFPSKASDLICRLYYIHFWNQWCFLQSHWLLAVRFQH